MGKQTEKLRILFILIINEIASVSAPNFSPAKKNPKCSPFTNSEIFIDSPEVELVSNLKCITNYIYIIFFQETLCILNICKNNIDEIWDLAPLRKLAHLFAADNQLQDLQVNMIFQK